jgi:formyltetrahydrofolate hydrolase
MVSKTAKKKIAILVSKEPACLSRLIDDVAQGKLDAQIELVLANHPDLEPVFSATNARRTDPT